MQVKRISLNAVEFAIAADLGLSLVEVTLSTCFAVELLDIVRACIEQVAVICLLVRCSKSTEDQYVLIRDLIESTALEANPIRVLLDSQVQRFPVLTSLDVILLNQVCALASVEACDDEECQVVECNRRVEVASRIQAPNLCPGIACNVVHFTLVHRLRGKRATDCVDS